VALGVFLVLLEGYVYFRDKATEQRTLRSEQDKESKYNVSG
jgi:hypothetical protein